MASEAPPFWWEKSDWRAWALWPASALYGRIAARRMENARRAPVGVPVLCVGNLTVGGSGKTPAAIALAEAARIMGLRPGFLSRGHGGSSQHPKLVDPHHDIARHVGDEPLLLARHAPVAVTPDRSAGAALLVAEGCDLLIMDDGFQSARIRIDHALVVVDSVRGIGNGHTIPGGPMRAPLVDQMRHADALLVVGDGDAAAPIVRRAAKAGLSFHQAHLAPRAPERIAGRRFLAFAGIGHPQKFFATVAACGGEVSATRSFADHHLYSDDDLAEIAASAEAAGLAIVTTAKDAIRLAGGSQDARAFLERIDILEIDLTFEPADAAERIIGETLRSFDRASHDVADLPHRA